MGVAVSCTLMQNTFTIFNQRHAAYGVDETISKDYYLKIVVETLNKNWLILAKNVNRGGTRWTYSRETIRIKMSFHHFHSFLICLFFFPRN